MKKTRFGAALLSLALLTGCSGNVDSALWESIEPATEEEVGEAKYEDGLYLTQNVQEPAEDPFADDTKLQKEGKTDDGIRYALYQEHAEITGHVSSFSVEELEIPSEIEGKPVTRIASVEIPDEDNSFEADKDGAFYGCYTLSRVVIPDSVLSIGDYAFYACKNLQAVELPETLAHIGKRAFAMCSNLNDITIPQAIGTIGDSAFSLTPWYDNLLFHRDLIIFNGRLYDVGRQCRGSVRVPDYVVEVCDYAFYACPTVNYVILPESVQRIGKCAFYDCTSLEDVVVLNKECEIEKGADTFTNGTRNGKDYFKGMIHGYEGSTAVKYAKRCGYKYDAFELFAEGVFNTESSAEESAEEPAEESSEESAESSEETSEEE